MVQVAFTEREPPGSQSWGTRTVLVVEDEDLIREMMAEVFQDEGYRVLTASDAGEAEALLAREAVDLMFTDIDLARGTNGWALACRARELRPGLPVIYASGRPQALGPGQAVAGSTFLSKPYRPGEVCALVDRMAGRLPPRDRDGVRTGDAAAA